MTDILTNPGSLTDTIDYGADQDQYWVWLNQGERYVFEADGISLHDPTLALRYDGHQVRYDDDAGGQLDSRIVYTADHSGWYQLDIGSFSSGTGSYRISSEDSVTSNESRWGVIDHAGDHDFYAIYLNHGQHYGFDVYGYSGYSGYVGDPTLTLRDGAGTQLAYNDDGGTGLNSHIEYTASSSGWYYLDVGSYGSHTGSYLLVA